jgi:Ca2+/Na+ antiporter
MNYWRNKYYESSQFYISALIGSNIINAGLVIALVLALR